MSLSTYIYRPYVCDPLGLYIVLVNNSIDQYRLIDQPWLIIYVNIKID